MNDPDRSTAKHHNAILALLEETTIAAAADRVGIGEATLRRWLREDDEFKTEYRTAKSEVFSQALNQLRQGATEAIRALREIVTDAETAPRVRVSAAQVLLNALLKGIQTEEIEERLTDLESRVVIQIDEQDARL